MYEISSGNSSIEPTADMEMQSEATRFVADKMEALGYCDFVKLFFHNVVVTTLRDTLTKEDFLKLTDKCRGIYDSRRC